MDKEDNIYYTNTWFQQEYIVKQETEEMFLTLISR